MTPLDSLDRFAAGGRSSMKLAPNVSLLKAWMHWKHGRYAKMHAAEVLSASLPQVVWGQSLADSQCFCTPKQCEWPKQFPVIRCFTPGCLEVQAPVEKAKVVPLDLICSEDGFIDGIIMASSRYAEIVYCSLLTIIQSGCFETVVCFYWICWENSLVDSTV